MERLQWIDRKFKFDLPIGWMPNLIARLDGTYPRLTHLCLRLKEDQLSFSQNSTWTIKEHIGHLADLEPLHKARVLDFIEAKTTLRAADMSNALTHQKNHNQQSLKQLLFNFKKERDEFIKSLKNLDPSTQDRTAIHPRLLEFMRPVDLAYFTAEHDDHHLASIYYILGFFK